MGACTFMTEASGKDLAHAYNAACSSALAEYGHQEGYNGTITTTDYAIDISAAFPKGTTTNMKLFVASRLYDPTAYIAGTTARQLRLVKAVYDMYGIPEKRGACFAFPLKNRTWLFFGWAAC